MICNTITDPVSQKEDWLKQLTDVITDPIELLKILTLDKHKDLLSVLNTQSIFKLRVPRSFVQRMTIKNAQDPLLLQVLPTIQEFINSPDYSNDPLHEQNNLIPSLLHKYKNRALFLLKSCCAINCRYCFRRYFPYQKNPSNKKIWKIAIDYINNHPEIDEIIFSGGDPLMAKDHELASLIKELENISHLKRLRIHTRLAVVIPARITEKLCQILSCTHLQVLLVSHINHMQEINNDLRDKMNMLKRAGVVLLNQSVLLRGVNNEAKTLANLSNALFDIGILPYYLHLLDKVKGTTHFFVSDNEARMLLRQMMTMVSGYMVPKLSREIFGEPSKTLIDLKMRQK